MGSTDRQLSESASVHHALYAFLSSAFAQPPTSATLVAVLSDEFLSEIGMVLGSAAAADLRAWARNHAASSDVEEVVRQEFMNLFKVPGGQYVTPYESVFRDAREIESQQVRGLLMGQSTVHVQKWYRLAALEISTEFRDLPDHIALELAFVAHLCVKEQEFAQAGDAPRLQRAREIHRDFLAAHIVPWVPALRDKIHQKSEHVYFRSMADLAVEVTRRDLRTLEDLLGPSERPAVPQYIGMPA